MASVATHLLEHPLALDPMRRQHIALGVAQRSHIDVAGDASRLHLGAGQELLLPEFDLAVRHRRRVDRRSLAVVTGGAAQLVGRMLKDDLFVIGMGAEGLSSVFEAALVLGRVTALTAV